MESWFTIQGSAPQVTVGWVSNDRAEIRKVVRSEEWADLRQKLDDYVEDFEFKIIQVSGRSGYQM
jgi:hypothetical protein